MPYPRMCDWMCCNLAEPQHTAACVLVCRCWGSRIFACSNSTPGSLQPDSSPETMSPAWQRAPREICVPCTACRDLGGCSVLCSSSGGRNGTRFQSCSALTGACGGTGGIRNAGRLAASAPSFWPDACGTAPEAGCSCRVALLAGRPACMHAPAPAASRCAAPPCTQHACMHEPCPCIEKAELKK